MVGNSEMEASKIDISATLRDYLVHLSLYATRSVQGLPDSMTVSSRAYPTLTHGTKVVSLSDLALVVD